MSIITRISQNCQFPESRIQVYIKKYSVERLLARCGAVKEKGVSVIAIFQYLLCLMFSDSSMYIMSYYLKCFCETLSLFIARLRAA